MLLGQQLHQVAEAESFNKLLQKILDLSQDVLQSEAATLFLVDKDRGELIFQIVNGSKSEELTGKRIQIGEGIAGKTAELGKPFLVNRAKARPEHVEKFDKQTGFKTESLLAAPLKVNNEIKGVIELINRKNGKYTEKSKVIIERLAEQLSSVLEIELLSERLRKSKEFLNVIINSLPGGIIILDENGNVKRVNQAAMDTLKVEKEVDVESNAENLSAIISDEDIVEKIREAEDNDEFEVVIDRENDRVHLHFDVSSAKEMGSSGIVRKYKIILISNITERVELDRLRHFQEMNVNFLSGISHHLRTPLTPILGLTQMLMEDDSLKDNVKDSIRVVYKEALRMKDMVERVLDVADLNETKFIELKDEIKLHELLEEIIKEINIDKINVKTVNADSHVLVNYKWLKKSLKNFLEIGLEKNENSSVKIFVKGEEDCVNLYIHGIENVIPDLRAIKNTPLLKFDNSPKKGKDMQKLDLSIVKLILKYHKVKIDINDSEGAINLKFNKVN